MSVRQGIADGRAFTTYVSSGVLNASLMKQLGATSEADFRAKLQANPEVAKPKVFLPPKVNAPISAIFPRR